MSTDWTVYDYEVDMFKGLLSLCRSDIFEQHSRYVQNAIVEALLLHTRILADILLSRDSASDAVTLKTLLPGFEPSRLAELKRLYGTRNVEGSPCWTLNKHLAHSTNVRSDSHDYTDDVMEKLRPLIQLCADEIEGERAKRGLGPSQPKVSVTYFRNFSTSSH